MCFHVRESGQVAKRRQAVTCELESKATTQRETEV